jgi:uncharacterized membrane protein
MDGWGEYAASWVAFLLSHILPVRPRLRRRIVASVGETTFLIGYSALSVAILAWVIVAAGRAPFVPLWGWAWWQAWVTNAAMILACMLLALGVGVSNPFSIGGVGNHRYDPARPGVVALTRHPVLWALAVWAGGHLVPNGDLAHLLLFGSFAALSLLGMRALDARRRAAWGAPRWAALQPRAPFRPDATRLLVGTAIWTVLIVSHTAVIGVPPWPSWP